jgi:hypothetical protein
VIAFVAVVVAALGVGLLSSAVGASAPPDLTGSWINPVQPSAPAWQLQSNGDRSKLTATWRGAPSHTGLVGHFSGTLGKGGTTYSGTFHVTEGSVKGHGPMSFKIDNPNRFTVSSRSTTARRPAADR